MHQDKTALKPVCIKISKSVTKLKEAGRKKAAERLKMRTAQNRDVLRAAAATQKNKKKESDCCTDDGG